MLFKNRIDAGRQLAEALDALSIKEGIVIGLPRGGVVVAAEIARRLRLPLDVIIPRKIGAPFNPELAIGALVENVVLLNDDLIREFNIDASYVKEAIEKEKKEAARRLELFRKGKPPQNLRNQTILVVDDGIATGATMRASLKYLKEKKAKRLIIAVPVGPMDMIEELKKEGYEVICLYSPRTFFAVGQFYEDFPQTEDNEVIQLLK